MIKNDIQLYFHCKKCMEELPEGKSPREYAQCECGYTTNGIQVWCKRHDIHIYSVELIMIDDTQFKGVNTKHQE